MKLRFLIFILFKPSDELYKCYFLRTNTKNINYGLKSSSDKELVTEIAKLVRKRTNLPLSKCFSVAKLHPNFEDALKYLRKHAVINNRELDSLDNPKYCISSIFDSSNTTVLLQLSGHSEAAVRSDLMIATIKTMISQIHQLILKSDENLLIDGRKLLRLKYYDTTYNENISLIETLELLEAQLRETIRIEQLIAIKVNSNHNYSKSWYVHNPKLSEKTIGEIVAFVITSFSVDSIITTEQLAMHLVSARPISIAWDDLPKQEKVTIQEWLLEQDINKIKPEYRNKVLKGKIKKKLKSDVLIYQEWQLDDSSRCINDLLKSNKQIHLISWLGNGNTGVVSVSSNTDDIQVHHLIYENEFLVNKYNSKPYYDLDNDIMKGIID